MILQYFDDLCRGYLKDNNTTSFVNNYINLRYNNTGIPKWIATGVPEDFARHQKFNKIHDENYRQLVMRFRLNRS
jgi:hypothetical protein